MQQTTHLETVVLLSHEKPDFGSIRKQTLDQDRVRAWIRKTLKDTRFLASLREPNHLDIKIYNSNQQCKNY
ncbi:hypothetical protein [Acetivibrio mesophilus]|nr:hypothetical protein [Acetivibrio mesophilus]